MASSSPVELGPFRLLAPLARGGMGEVWRGIHVATGLPVALKLLPPEHAADAPSRRRFLEEVRAVASLDHPHIVTVLDAGTVSSDAAAASQGRLQEGGPWLAMELASGGTLLESPVDDFDALRLRLAEVLDGLAHAHAHGVLHLDLKPSNLLLCARRDARPGLKISDFGMARAASDESTMLAEHGGGTPAYMAPEQLLSESSQLGPWSDLYGVGCVAWAMTTGAPPYLKRSAVATARAVLSKSLPAFVPRFPCPEGFQAWVQALLARSPDERPRRAADALAALQELELRAEWTEDEDDEQTASFGVPVISPDEPTQHGFDLSGLEAEAEMDAPALGPMAVRMPPPPTVGPWQRPRASQPQALVGAGLGLIGVRRRPLVGRDEHQQRLWNELRLVHGSRRPRVVVVRGEAGVGRTALVEWLATRAEEVGAARSWGVRAEPRALEASVLRWLRIDRVAPEERRPMIAAALGEARADSVSALLDGTLKDSARRGVVRALVKAATTERPLVFWVDDAHEQPELLQLVADLSRLEVAALFVVVVTEEALATRVAESLLVDQLEGEVLQLEPLTLPARRELLAGLVGLDPDLAEPLALRSGHPLFLEQLLGQWAARGLLRPGDRGLVLAPGAQLELPDDLHGAWLQRVEEVLAPLEPAAGWDLHVASVLGRSFEEGVWHTACDDPEGEGFGWEAEGLARRQALVEGLVAAGLLRSDGERFTFTHGLLVEALERQSREMGRTQWLHHACAHALLLHQVGDGARLGLHLLRAGEPEGAIGPLLEAVVERARRRPTDALQVLLVAEEAANEAALPPTSLVSLALLVTRAEVHLAAKERPEALRWSRWAQQAVVNHGVEADPAEHPRWQEHLARAIRVEHDVFVAMGSPEEARRALMRLEPVVRQLGEPRAVGDVLLARARWAEGADLQEEAGACLREALDCYEGSAVDQASVRLRQGAMELSSGRLDRAALALDEALAMAEELASERVLWGGLLALRGEVALLREEEAAAGWLEEGGAVQASTGADASRARLLASVAVGPNDPAEGATAARHAAQHVPTRARLRPLCELCLAIAEARVRRWPAVHEAVARWELRPGGDHPTIAWLAARLADDAEQAGFPQLSERVRGRASR